MNSFLRAGLLSIVTLLGGCSSKAFGITYGVDVANYGQNGVIILQLGQAEAWVRKKELRVTSAGHEYWMPGPTAGLEDLPFVIAMNPSIPSHYRNPADSFGRFKDYPDSLPEEIEVVWQLAELKGCSRIVPVRSEKKTKELMELGFNPGDHFNKSGCTWVPQPDKIYRKKLDVTAIKETEAYKRTGKSNPDVALSRYTLNLTMIFNEDQLTVEAANSTTNPWR